MHRNIILYIIIISSTHKQTAEWIAISIAIGKCNIAQATGGPRYD